MQRSVQAKQRITNFIMFCFIIALIVSGCSANTANEPEPDPSTTEAVDAPEPSDSGGEPASTELEPVELIWYYPQPAAQADLQAVNDAVNEITKAKINATVKLSPIDFANYETKMNTIAAASEPADIIWTSTWNFVWVDNQAKGVFQPLDELLKTHGQKLYDSMPEKFWNDAKLHDQIWAVPSFQISARRPSLILRKDLVEKYNFDVSTLKKTEDIEPFLQQVKDNEPGLVPFGVASGFFDGLYYNMDPFTTFTYLNDSSNKVIEDPAPPGYRQYLNMVYSWYQKGFINQDAATVADLSTVIAKGNVAAWWDHTGKPGGETAYKAANGGHDVIMVPMQKAYFTGASSTMNAISRTSKNPERAIMFLELVNTDRELFNTLVFGIEGKHYTRIDDKFAKPIPDSGYDMVTSDWIFGNTTNGYLPEGAPADKYEQTIKVNEEAIVSPFYGFVFDTEPVKTEWANREAVNQEYAATLESGTVDPEQYLPIYIDKQIKAGIEKINAERQKQLDAFLASKK